MNRREDRHTEIEIRRLAERAEADVCARLMAGSEPWITLRRTYDQALRMLEDPEREVSVGLVKGEVVGFVILRMDGAFSGYIQTVGVVPGWRNQGVGTRLIRFAEERIFTERPNVFLCVSSFNDRAKRLYHRLGYETVGEIDDFIVRGFSEVLLRKTIAPLTEFKRPM